MREGLWMNSMHHLSLYPLLIMEALDNKSLCERFKDNYMESQGIMCVFVHKGMVYNWNTKGGKYDYGVIASLKGGLIIWSRLWGYGGIVQCY